jgi:RNA polymerase sigma-70 factor, ECF subfamily
MSPADKTSEEVLLARACEGDVEAAGEVFENYRDRLRRMVQLRLDPSLRRRVDASDILQESFLDFARKVQDRDPEQMPLHLWLRLITGERLLQVHRRHLDTAARALGREVSLGVGTVPDVSSVSLAENLLAGTTSPSMKVAQSELKIRLEKLVNGMDPMDREILVLRHFEELTNEDVSRLLGIKKSAASNRYVRALGRLRKLLDAE